MLPINKSCRQAYFNIINMKLLVYSLKAFRRVTPLPILQNVIFFVSLSYKMLLSRIRMPIIAPATEIANCKVGNSDHSYSTRFAS